MSSLQGHTSTINSLCFNNDSQTLVSGSYDGTVKIWNLEQASLLKSLDFGDKVIYVKCIKDNNIIAASMGGKIKFLEFYHGRITKRIANAGSSSVR